jgi:hypothetical protein
MDVTGPINFSQLPPAPLTNFSQPLFQPTFFNCSFHQHFSTVLLHNFSQLLLPSTFLNRSSSQLFPTAPSINISQPLLFTTFPNCSFHQHFSTDLLHNTSQPIRHTTLLSRNSFIVTFQSHLSTITFQSCLLPIDLLQL